MREGFKPAPGASRGLVAGGRLAAVRRRRALAGAILLTGLFSVAAPPPSGAGDEPQGPAFNDPLEPLNRLVFAVNETLDTIILRPAAEVYGAVVPGAVRRGVRNVVRHLSLPFTFVNDVAQGEWERSGDTAQRFVINTMVGFAGLYDVAAEQGLPHRSTDFGSTLAAWGVGDGPYLVLPVAGPSSVRDAAGMLIQGAADPVDAAFRRTAHDHLPLVRAGAATLDFRYRNLETIDDFKANALDYYTFVRTLYRQRRAFETEDDPEMRLSGGKDESGDDYAYPPPRPDFARDRPGQ